MLLVSSDDASFVFQCFVGLGPRCTEVLRDLRASGPEIWLMGLRWRRLGRSLERLYLLQRFRTALVTASRTASCRMAH